VTEENVRNGFIQERRECGESEKLYYTGEEE
jgi:hypothetical protein